MALAIPEPLEYAIQTIRDLLGKQPVFGICLGHQLLSLASGAKTFKMKFGHRGANQPVQQLSDGTVEITSQNHGFAVDEESLPSELEVTHRSLNDGTIEGVRRRDVAAFSVQYHPEASAGPHDSHYLFKQFMDAMAESLVGDAILDGIPRAGSPTEGRVLPCASAAVSRVNPDSSSRRTRCRHAIR